MTAADNIFDIHDLSLMRIIGDDALSVNYRPRINQFSGGVLATIFLQRCIYWDDISGGNPFFKFQEPCEHPLYVKLKEKHGQYSWCEELGYSKHELATVLKNIGYKYPSKEKRKIYSETDWEREKSKKEKALIWYWMGPNRITYWSVNKSKIVRELSKLYSNKPVNRNPVSGIMEPYIPEFGITKSRNSDYHINSNSLNSNSINNKFPKDENTNRIPYQEIIDSFNKHLKNLNPRAKGYTLSSKYKNQIKQIWDQNFKLEDFETVFAQKADELQRGGEEVFNQFFKYFNLETLFRHFQEYLNGQKVWKSFDNYSFKNSEAPKRVSVTSEITLEAIKTSAPEFYLSISSFLGTQQYPGQVISWFPKYQRYPEKVHQIIKKAKESTTIVTIQLKEIHENLQELA